MNTCPYTERCRAYHLDIVEFIPELQERIRQKPRCDIPVPDRCRMKLDFDAGRIDDERTNQDRQALP